MSHELARASERSRERPIEPSGDAGSERAAASIAPGAGQPAGALRDVHARASELVAAIAADAAADPEQYLRTTVVPEGGE